MNKLSLDNLLDATGINDLTGAQFKKTAVSGSNGDFSKLAERCRQAADATPEDVQQSNHQGLVEKTAAIVVIQKTLSEISAIEGTPSVKTAAAVRVESGRAVFIKSALEAGHDPEEIAKFLEKKDKSEDEDEDEKEKKEEEAKKKSASTIIS